MGADWRPRRARAPCLENKNSAPQARFRSQTPSKQAKVHAFWLPKQQCNQPQPPQPPHWSTRPTGPVDHPADPPTHRAPHPHPTLALGLRTLGAPGPPQGPLFSVFVLPCSLTASDTPGRPLTERSKTLGPWQRPEGGCIALYDVWRVWLYGCMAVCRLYVLYTLYILTGEP